MLADCEFMLTWMNFPKREEFLLRTVIALPKASITGFDDRT